MSNVFSKSIKQNDFLFGFLTSIQIFISPSKAALDSSGFDETILVLMDNLSDHPLKSIGQ